jgi:hypothetical protein
MMEAPDHKAAPDGWLDALEESESQLQAGHTVPGDIVRQNLRESVARLKAKKPAARRQDAPAQS